MFYFDSVVSECVGSDCVACVVSLFDIGVGQCVVAFGADSSEVAGVVSAACVYWCDVIDLCAGCFVADCADWLFSKYVPPVF